MADKIQEAEQPEIKTMTNAKVADASKPVQASEIVEDGGRWVGRVLDQRYEIERVLGRGGMGVVLLARQMPINRRVVVKVLSRRLLDDEVARKRFEREAQSLSNLKHPNIVTLHDYGHDGDLPYIVMEYIEGKTLAKVMQRRRRLGLRLFFPLAVQLLAAIGAAHRHGWVHRDLKPDNIMVSPRKNQPDFIKVLDFGLARMLSTEEDITKQNLMGTALYLSPEQIQGMKIDQRSDVYALGILFYLLLTGKRPFKSRDDVNLMFQHLSAEPEPLEFVLPEGHDIPPGVCALIHRCLQKDPAARPADATEVLQLLLSHTANEDLDLPQIELPKLAERTPSTDDNLFAIMTEEITDLGAVALTFLAATSEERFDEADTNVFDGLFANTGELTGGRPSSIMRQAMTNAPTAIQPAAAPVSPAPRSHSQRVRVGPAAAPPTPWTQAPVSRQTGNIEMVRTQADNNRRLMWQVVIGALCVAIAFLIAGIVVTVLQGQNHPTNPPVTAEDSRRTAIVGVIEQCETLLSQGRYGEIEQMLSAIEGEAIKHPDLIGRMASVREGVNIARLQREAKDLERNGDLAGAIKVHQTLMDRSADQVKTSQAEVDRLRAAIKERDAKKNTPPPLPEQVEEDPKDKRKKGRKGRQPKKGRKKSPKGASNDKPAGNKLVDDSVLMEVPY